MKSSASIAISLTLLMFILVLAAAVFFLLQGQQSLKGELSTAQENNKTLLQQQAAMELDEHSIQATLETSQNLHATAAVENADLEGQLLVSEQANATLEASSAQQLSELDNANATITSYESQGPVVNIVEPQSNANLLVEQPVEIVIVASDATGITNINYNIGGELFTSPIEEGPVVTLRETWIPTTEGTFTLTASAINSSGISSRPSQFSEITFIVIAQIPTNTPLPTEEPTPTSTPES